jgi:hypothetical protein
MLINDPNFDVDETYVKVNGGWRYVYRAIDQHGQVIDVLISARRDAASARRFFTGRTDVTTGLLPQAEQSVNLACAANQTGGSTTTTVTNRS